MTRRTIDFPNIHPSRELREAACDWLRRHGINPMLTPIEAVTVDTEARTIEYARYVTEPADSASPVDIVVDRTPWGAIPVTEDQVMQLEAAPYPFPPILDPYITEENTTA